MSVKLPGSILSPVGDTDIQSFFDQICKEENNKALTRLAMHQPPHELLSLIFTLSVNDRTVLAEHFSHSQLDVRIEHLKALQHGLQLILLDPEYLGCTLAVLEKRRRVYQLSRAAAYAENECYFAQTSIETKHIIQKQVQLKWVFQTAYIKKLLAAA